MSQVLCLLVLALVSLVAAETYIWNGGSLSFNSTSAWRGIATGSDAAVVDANPSGPNFPSSTTFGGANGYQIHALLPTAATVDVGTRLTMNSGSFLVVGGRIEFGNPANTAMRSATTSVYVAGLPGFLNPRGPVTTDGGAGRAAAFDYNCPLNWRTASGAIPQDAPQGDDDVIIGAGGYFVSTFGSPSRAQTVTAGSTVFTDAAMMCPAYNDGVNVPGTSTAGPSLLNFGSTGCSNFNFGGQTSSMPSLCGNLMEVSLPGSAPNSNISLFVCADGSTTCSLGGSAILRTYAADGSVSVTTTPVTTDPATGAITVTGARGSVTLVPGGGPPVVVTPGPATSSGSSASASNGGLGFGLWIIIAVVAAIIIVVVVIVAKKARKDPSPRSGHDSVAFENPVYESNIADDHIVNPTFDGTEVSFDGNYDDLPARDVDDFAEVGGDNTAQHNEQMYDAPEISDGYMDVHVDEDTNEDQYDTPDLADKNQNEEAENDQNEAADDDEDQV